jgi:hypothetical protein
MACLEPALVYGLLLFLLRRGSHILKQPNHLNDSRVPHKGGEKPNYTFFVRYYIKLLIIMPNTEAYTTIDWIVRRVAFRHAHDSSEGNCQTEPGHQEVPNPLTTNLTGNGVENG